MLSLEMHTEMCEFSVSFFKLLQALIARSSERQPTYHKEFKIGPIMTVAFALSKMLDTIYPKPLFPP